MKRLKRSLDLLWDIETPKRSVLIFLLPLSGSASIEGFLFRVEGSLKKQFNSDFSNSNIGIHHVALSAAEPEWVLDDLLNRCRVNSIRAVPADISDATAPLPMATH